LLVSQDYLAAEIETLRAEITALRRASSFGFSRGRLHRRDGDAGA
jgi:hypothetical protein